MGATAISAGSSLSFPEVYRVLDEAEIKGYIASRDHRGPKGCFGPECFIWKEGRLFCPNEQPMMAVQTHNDDKVTYQGQECATCALREQCVGHEAQKPRTLLLRLAVETAPGELKLTVHLRGQRRPRRWTPG